MVGLPHVGGNAITMVNKGLPNAHDWDQGALVVGLVHSCQQEPAQLSIGQPEGTPLDHTPLTFIHWNTE